MEIDFVRWLWRRGDAMTLSVTAAVVWIVATLSTAAIASYLAKRFGDGVLIAVFVACICISIVSATKIISFVGFNIPAGTIVFATTFLITDIISEFYGKERARFAVWCGFLAMVLYLLYSFVTVHWPPAPFWANQEQYETIVSLSARVAFAGVVAYLFSQMMDVTIYHWLRTWTKGRHIWIRNNGSTIISQAVDSAVFLTIAFGGVYPLHDLFIGLYVVKVGIAIIDTPIIYLVRWIHMRTPSPAPATATQ